jgi:hypothetical protein
LRVQIKGAPRENAAAKDSAWVRERQTLEADQPADVNEIILVNPGAVATLRTPAACAHWRWLSPLCDRVLTQSLPVEQVLVHVWIVVRPQLVICLQTLIVVAVQHIW